MQHSYFHVKRREGTKLQGKQTETKPENCQEKIILCFILPYRIGFTNFKNNSAKKCRADFSTQASKAAEYLQNTSVLNNTNDSLQNYHHSCRYSFFTPQGFEHLT